MIAVLATLAGCVVVRSWRGEKGADVGHIQPGTRRAEAETVLGLPAREWVSPAGVRYALYEYNAGIPPHYGDAMTAALLDVITFGVFELLAFTRDQGRHPGEYDRRRPRVVIAYDAYGVIRGIFDESDELPPDGRSGSYRWARWSSLEREHRDSLTASRRNLWIISSGAEREKEALNI